MIGVPIDPKRDADLRRLWGLPSEQVGDPSLPPSTKTVKVEIDPARQRKILEDMLR